MPDANNFLTFGDKLKRIIDSANDGPPDQLSSSLVHAYAGCLSIEELATAIIATWQEKAIVRRAILKKTILIGSHSDNQDAIDRIGMHILAACGGDRKARIYFDSALAQLFHQFSPSLRKCILDVWIDRGTAGAGDRWLKAIKSDELLFSYADVKKILAEYIEPKCSSNFS